MTEGLSGLVTEQYRPDLADLDRQPTEELVRIMNAEDARVPHAIARAVPEIAAAIDGIVERLRAGGRLIYVGAGTAGRIGILDAVECGPTFTSAPDQVIGVMAGGPRAVVSATESVEDRRDLGASDFGSLGVTGRDAVVGVSASGCTPYTLGAVEYARRAGALTVGLSCNPESQLSRLVEYPIEIVVGPEVIAGSTRLKAGTAQKLVLNMLSTIAMIRLGKTLGNLMVDVRATNEKLRDRSRRIVELATGVDGPDLDRVLVRSGGNAKVAIVMLLAEVDVAEAERRLAKTGGRVREALGEHP
jgi:N-acetylmuramic acid 6-phosphate etherase